MPKLIITTTTSNFRFDVFNCSTPTFESQAESLTKKQRKRQRQRTARNLKQLFAAYHFLSTSRDGAVIAHIVGAKPIELYRWSLNDSWIKALRYWQPHYNGDGMREGAYFQYKVGDSIVERSLKSAKEQWVAYVEGGENKKLRKTLQMFEEMGFTE